VFVISQNLIHRTIVTRWQIVDAPQYIFQFVIHDASVAPLLEPLQALPESRFNCQRSPLRPNRG